MAEFLPSSLPELVWHVDYKVPGDCPSFSTDESYPSQPSRGQKLFLVSPEMYLFIYLFYFSDVLNKFLIIEANRCSLANILGLTWLQNHFADLHTLGLARLLAKGESSCIASFSNGL